MALTEAHHGRILRGQSPGQAPGGAEADRRTRILEAAERAFVRQGFHATTMQDVAAEAGMSPGNLYRYFRSKEAIVKGLCAQDQEERAQAFAMLAQSGNVIAAMAAGIRDKLLNEPREKMQMVLEIWAEAGRNPTIAGLCGAIDEDVRQGLTKLIGTAKARGETADSVDPAFVARSGSSSAAPMRPISTARPRSPWRSESSSRCFAATSLRIHTIPVADAKGADRCVAR